MRNLDLNLAIFHRNFRKSGLNCAEKDKVSLEVTMPTKMLRKGSIASTVSVENPFSILNKNLLFLPLN